MNSPRVRSDSHIAIIQAAGAAKQLLNSISRILSTVRDPGVNGALIEAQSFLSEAISSLSKAAELSKGN